MAHRVVGCVCNTVTGLLPLALQSVVASEYFGAVSGTLSYVSGGKLGALMVNGDGLVWIAAEWGLALPLLVWLAQKEKRMSFKRRILQLPKRLLRRAQSERDSAGQMDSTPLLHQEQKPETIQYTIDDWEPHYSPL